MREGDAEKEIGESTVNIIIFFHQVQAPPEGRKNGDKKRKNLSFNIQNVLRAKILSGELKGGTPLPSNADLQKEFGVSLITANRAMCVLAQEGLIVRKQGQGSYVRDNSFIVFFRKSAFFL